MKYIPARKMRSHFRRNNDFYNGFWVGLIGTLLGFILGSIIFYG